MNCLDPLSLFPCLHYKKYMGISKENLCFDFAALQRVKW